MKLKGSEKQIKWAEDIISDARATIKINIEKNKAELEKCHCDTLVENIKKWEKLQVQYDATIARIDSAAFVIEHRDKLSANYVVNVFNRL